MGVSLTGSSLTFTMVRRAAAAVIAVFCVLFYLYGPAASPTLRAAATEQCNARADGNYRSYRLSWQVGVYPHWTCSNAARPAERAVSLGWWTNPF